MLLAFRLGSLLWSNAPSVLQNPDFHIKPWKCDFEKYSLTFCYFVLLVITLVSLLLNNSPSDLQTTSRGSVVLNNARSLFATLRWQPLPREVYFWTTLQQFCIKVNICMHLTKCIFEHHSVTLRILTSNYPGQIGLWLFWRPSVSQSRHVDNKIS